MKNPTYKYQQEFALELCDAWLTGKKEYVRTTIRNLKNKVQSAYIAAAVALYINAHEKDAAEFAAFIHPNNG